MDDLNTVEFRFCARRSPASKRMGPHRRRTAQRMGTRMLSTAGCSWRCQHQTHRQSSDSMRRSISRPMLSALLVSAASLTDAVAKQEDADAEGT